MLGDAAEHPGQLALVNYMFLALLGCLVLAQKDLHFSLQENKRHRDGDCK